MRDIAPHDQSTPPPASAPPLLTPQMALHKMEQEKNSRSRAQVALPLISANLSLSRSLSPRSLARSIAFSRALSPFRARTRDLACSRPRSRVLAHRACSLSRTRALARSLSRSLSLSLALALALALALSHTPWRAGLPCSRRACNARHRSARPVHTTTCLRPAPAHPTNGSSQNGAGKKFAVSCASCPSINFRQPVPVSLSLSSLARSLDRFFLARSLSLALSLPFARARDLACSRP